MLIGPGRSGSSWIYQCLKEHSQICIDTPEKEYEDMELSFEFLKNLSSLKDCGQNKIKGWFARYLQYAEKTAPLIKQNFPDVKLIVNLRNPIERIYSHYLLKKAGGGINYSFGDFIAKNKELIKVGFYHSQLQTFFKFFPRENMLILLYEDIEKDPFSFIKKICEFLGADSNYALPSINKRIYPTAKSILFLPFLSKANLAKIKKILKKHCGGKLITLLKTVKIGSFIYFILKKNRMNFSEKKPSQKPMMNSETRKYLQEIYKKEIYNLGKLINRNLSFWE